MIFTNAFFLLSGVKGTHSVGESVPVWMGIWGVVEAIPGTRSTVTLSRNSILAVIFELWLVRSPVTWTGQDACYLDSRDSWRAGLCWQRGRLNDVLFFLVTELLWSQSPFDKGKSALKWFRDANHVWSKEGFPCSIVGGCHASVLLAFLFRQG